MCALRARKNVIIHVPKPIFRSKTTLKKDGLIFVLFFNFNHILVLNLKWGFLEFDGLHQRAFPPHFQQATSTSRIFQSIRELTSGTFHGLSCRHERFLAPKDRQGWGLSRDCRLTEELCWLWELGTTGILKCPDICFRLSLCLDGKSWWWSWLWVAWTDNQLENVYSKRILHPGMDYLVDPWL